MAFFSSVMAALCNPSAAEKAYSFFISPKAFA